MAISPGPWKVEAPNWIVAADDSTVMHVDPYGNTMPTDDDARLMLAAPELLEALEKLEAAETFNANCDECEGDGVPELCQKCFPHFDDARVLRRLAISKATGKS